MLVLAVISRIPGGRGSAGSGERTPESFPTTTPLSAEAAGGERHWGQLETELFILERPDDLLRPLEEFFDQPSGWRFGNLGGDAVEELFQRANLDGVAASFVGDRGNWKVTDGGLMIEPPDEVVRSLKPDARAVIYRELSRIPGNPFKNEPFTFPTARTSLWFSGAAVSSSTRALIKELLYPRGGVTCFSDLSLLGRHVPHGERRAVLRMLSRIPATRAFLQIGPDSDLEQLAQYWGAGGRVRHVLPFLAGLKQAPSASRVELSLLLPRICRERLYTFPETDYQQVGGAVDCFWTAFNFFRSPPEAPFVDALSRPAFLEANYDVIKGEPVYGDLLVLFDDENQPVHVCVYLAGDTVFTKNGPSVFSPWLLMSFTDVLANYSMEGRPKVRVYRPRHPPPS